MDLFKFSDKCCEELKSLHVLGKYSKLHKLTLKKEICMYTSNIDTEWSNIIYNRDHYKSKEEGKDQESIQSVFTDPGHCMGK